MILPMHAALIIRKTDGQGRFPDLKNLRQKSVFLVS